MPVLPWVLDLFVCASPAVLRAAAGQFGPASPPLVCTEGEPSGACEPLTGRPGPSPWDDRLADVMRAAGRQVTEDRMLRQLLAGLDAARSDA
jgi:hypothetical protein